MDSAFLTALREPAPVRCLGVSLVPLTLGHFFLLRQWDSAFLTGGQASIEDLIMGCFVCCQDAGSARRGLRSLLLPLVMKLWGRRARRSNLALDMIGFRRYIKDGTAAPSTVISHGAGDSMRDLNSPVEWRLLVMLMVDFHLTEAEALKMTMLKANVLWATLGDRDGKVQLVSEQTRMLIEMAGHNGRAN